MPHRFQIEFGGEIEHGEIFVVECLRGRRLFVLAIGEIVVELFVRFDMPIDIHRHESGELHEARIDVAESAGIAHRNGCGQHPLEPRDVSLVGKLIDLGRVDPAIDRPGHQRHASRLRRIGGLRHERHRAKNGYAGLADRKNMRARTHDLEIFDQVFDIFVDAETAGGNRHVARIMPIGNEHVVLGQQSAHRCAQQRREMAGERRHHEHARLGHCDVLLEMQERAEGRARGRLFPHFDFAVTDIDVGDAERRPGVREARARNQFVSGAQIAMDIVAEQRLRAGRKRHGRPGPNRGYHVGLSLVGEVQHPLPTGAAVRLATETPAPLKGKASAFLVALRQDCEHPAQWLREVELGNRRDWIAFNSSK